MIKFFTPLTIIFILLITSSCQSSKSGKDLASKESDPSKIIISNYDGGEVTLSEAQVEVDKIAATNKNLKGLTFDKLNPQQKEAIIKEVVLKEIAYKEAKKRNLNKDKEYEAALKIFEEELLKQKLFVQLTKAAMEEENLKIEYDKLAKNLKDKKDLKISYIALDTEKKAQSIYQELIKKPNLFSSYARRNSIDKETAKKGGELGFVLEDALPAEVVKQAKILEKGQVSKPISTSSNRWVIIKMEDQRAAEIVPFEKAKDVLAQNLAKKAITDFVSQSLEKAKISIVIK